MNIKAVDPALRFEVTGLGNDVAWGDAGWESGPLYTKYVCAGCKEGVVFSKADLIDGCRRPATNLTPTIASQFDACSASNGIKENGFLDWLCPQCHLARRIYVRPWAGGHHGDSGVQIVALLEEE
jgi:hypothetical protein